MPYSQEQMFALVNDVGAYETFLPWCKRSQVLSQNATEIQAKLTLTKGGMEKSFTTINALTPTSKMVMALVDGPFKHLRGTWRFTATGERECQIELNLEFQFSNKLVEMMFGPFFQQAANRLVDAFVERANVIYKA